MAKKSKPKNRKRLLLLLSLMFLCGVVCGGIIITQPRCRALLSRLVHKIESGDSYLIDNLTHSIPYLTSSAAQLLDAIGQSFTLSLRSKGIEPHRIIVTSVLRTQEDVRKLQSSGNVNASNNSAHSYATTFDITYVRYSKDGFRGRSASEQELFDTLVEVLQRFKNEGRCYVKYEIQQRCFHITTRQ